MNPRLRSGFAAVRIAAVPVAGLLLGLLGRVGWERLFPLRIELTLASDAPRTLEAVFFPARPAATQPQELSDAREQRVSFELPEVSTTVAIKLGETEGALLVRSIILRRRDTLREWSALDGFPDWKVYGGVEQRIKERDGLALDLEAKPAFLTNPRLAEWTAQDRHRRRGIASAWGAILGAILAVRPALRVWRQASPTQRRLALRLALSGASAAVALFAVLPFLRRALTKPGGYQDPTGDYDFSFLDHHGRRLSKQVGQLGLLLDPFCYYRNFPGQTNDSLTIDENGFRGGIGDRSKPLAFVLGGSTAFGFGLASDGQALPGQLAGLLDAYTWVNAGHSGYASGQELAFMVHYADSFRPGLYLVLDGWNDYLEGDYYPQIYPELAQLPVLAANNQFFQIGQRLNERAMEDSRGSLPPWPFAPPEVRLSRDERLELALRTYVDNLERMSNWARSRRGGMLVAIQPMLGTKSVLTEEERRLSQLAPDCTARYRQFARDAAARCGELGIACINLVENPEVVGCEDTLFMDVCHLTPDGLRLVASILARELRQLRL